MLAASAIPIIDRTTADWPNGWIIEHKVDGIRVMLIVTNGSAVLFSRSGRTINAQFPEVMAATHRSQLGSVVLDAELTAGPFARTNGRASLTNAREIRARALSNPAELHVFDVLSSGKEDLKTRPLHLRRSLLDRMPWNGTIHQVRSFTTPDEAVAAVFAENLEGVMLKRPDSRYNPGRSNAWLKAKRQRRATCLVIGHEPGNGGRAHTFGALVLGLVDGGHILRVGKVGTGFDTMDLAQVKALLESGRPFAVDVGFLEVSENRQLRFPVYLGLRPDIDLTTAAILRCSVDQL